MLLWDIKAGAHNRMEIMLVVGIIAIVGVTLEAEATTMAMVLHSF